MRRADIDELVGRLTDLENELDAKQAKIDQLSTTLDKGPSHMVPALDVACALVRMGAMKMPANIEGRPGALRDAVLEALENLEFEFNKDEADLVRATERARELAQLARGEFR